MKAFISIPMSGKTSEKILNDFEKCKSVIKDHSSEKDITFITSYIPPDKYHNDIYYLGVAISKLSTADIIYMHPYWKNSKGCNIEHMIAKTYNIPIVYLEDYLDKRTMNG